MPLGLLKENISGRVSDKSLLFTECQRDPSTANDRNIHARNRSRFAKFQAIFKTFLAYGLYFLFGARRVGHWLGVLPYLPVSSLRFTCQTFSPPTRFDYAKFNGFPTDGFWDRPTPSQATLNRTLTIPGGSADQDGFVFDANCRPVFEACHPLRQRMKYRRRRWRDSVPVGYRKQHLHPRHYQGRVAILTSQHQHLYSHWLLDILPRLAKLQESYERADYYFLQYSHPFQVETIDTLGLTSEGRVINSIHVPWVSGDELVVPCHQILFGYHYPRWVCDWLRKTFLPSRNRSPKPKRKIYVSRSLAGRRMVTNEREISIFLSSCGFELCMLERLSFAEQVALFQGAEVIVAPHGSGLANLVFCDPGTRVIELFPSRATDAYFRLCVDMNLNYTCLKTREVSSHPRVSDNFSINVDDLRVALCHIGSSRSC